MRVVVLLLAAAAHAATVMECHPSFFLGSDTRTLTCAIAAAMPKYSGRLEVTYRDQTIEAHQVTITQATNNGELEHWGITAVQLEDATKPIDHVDFYTESKLATWDGPAPMAVITGLSRFTPYSEPQVITIDQMRCDIWQVDGQTRAVTCGTSSPDAVTYTGTFATYFQGAAQYVPEKGKATITHIPMIALAGPLDEVRFDHYALLDEQGQWGIASWGIQQTQPKVIQRVSFFPTSPAATWDPTAPPPARETKKVAWWRRLLRRR